MSDSTLITAEQVATINEARTVLAAIAHDAHMEHDSQASGMIFALAVVAGGSLFELLNWFDAHTHGDLSNAQLHNDADYDRADRADRSARLNAVQSGCYKPGE